MSWFDERFTDMHGRPRFECTICARPMWFPASKHGKYKTCGGRCAAELKRSGVAARTRACATCGGAFTPRGTQLAAGAGLYCSQACNVASHTAMNAAESQRRAKAAWKERNAVAPIVKAGPEHPRWKGGRGETYRRLLATGKLRLAYNKRRDRMGGAVVLPSEIRAIGASQRWLCVACRVDISAAYEMDHIVPLSRGGRHEKHNIQLLCATCNRSKNAKHPIDFMQSRGYLL